jgi:hypothetical protein
VGDLIASKSERSAVIESDWFWTTIVNGHIEPWEQAAHEQNQAVVRAFTAAAVRMANAGYSTVLEGIIGPWFFDLLSDELRACSTSATYCVLRPDADLCFERAQARVREDPRHRDALTEERPIRQMWQEFSHLRDAEHFVIDNSHERPVMTAGRIWERLSDPAYALPTI